METLKKRIFRYLKHIFGTLIVVTLIIALILLSEDGAIHYGDNPTQMNWENDGPYVFFKNDTLLEVNYIHGDQEKGFSINQKTCSIDSIINLTGYFNLDQSKFNFSIYPGKIKSPQTTYSDKNKIFVISDIESGFNAFRKILIQNKIIDKKMNWKFGKGHLVLLGDFVDRGFSTTQVLWFIYKLEKEAEKEGGHVHFIIGNHEIKNMQSDFESASPKFQYIAAILGRQQHELYNQKSFLGLWMSSKNTLEIINGNLFVHGGVHPDIVQSKLNIQEINDTIRSQYYLPYFPKAKDSPEQIFTSTSRGIAWYRGYFKDTKLTQTQVDQVLAKFKAKAVIVGHTLQSKVNRSFNGKVIGIDVQHPKDYHKNYPTPKSEALFIENNNYFRIFNEGEKEKI
jgi:hypothetical protein